jgi:ATP synthase protein I
VGDALADGRATETKPPVGAAPRQPLSSAPIIRLGLMVSAVIAVGAVALGAGLRGWPGVTAALLGVGIVMIFFSVSKVAVGFVARRAPQLLLPAALGIYGFKILLLGVLLVALDGVEAVNLSTLAWTVLAGVFGWVGAEVWAATHTRVPFFDPATFAARHPDAVGPPDGHATRSPARGASAPGSRG